MEKESALWHRVSEKEKEEIKKEAKKIMDDFSKALAGIKIKDGFVEREQFERKEDEGKSCDGKFRDVVLKNAPNKNKDFIIAEKGEWTG